MTQQLLLGQGIETVFMAKRAQQWLRDGGQLEDEPACRASNHFHNPLNFFTWTNSNMSDMPWPLSGAVSSATSPPITQP